MEDINELKEKYKILIESKTKIRNIWFLCSLIVFNFFIIFFLFSSKNIFIIIFSNLTIFCSTVTICFSIELIKLKRKLKELKKS